MDLLEKFAKAIYNTRVEKNEIAVRKKTNKKEQKTKTYGYYLYLFYQD